MQYKNILLIVVIAFLFRFYHLGQVPPSINWDEASNGYNAYSILKTARDEYGTFLPLYNRSFDDYKPPLYMYLSIPSVKYFGLTEFAVRLPSAILGTLMVLIMYFFTKKLFTSQKVAMIASFLLAISSWNIHFSRVGFESNIGLFSGFSAMTLLLYSLPHKGEEMAKKNILLLILSSTFFALSFYSYHSARIFIPIIFAVFVIIYRKEFLSIPKKIIFLFFTIPIILIAPFFVTAPREAIRQRYQTVSLGAQKVSTDDFIKYVQQDSESFLSRQIHNRRILLFNTYLQNYLSHFNPEFLFISGDRNLRHHTEGSGMIPLFFMPLILIGLYKFIEKHDKTSLVTLAWLLAPPIAAAPADAAPHAVRSIFMSVGLIIAATVGMKTAMDMARLRTLVIVTLAIAVLFYLFTYLHNYYLHYPRDKAEFWMYGFKETVIESMKLKDQYPVINVDASIEQGYIFWLFYNKYDPTAYQASALKPNIYNFRFNNNKVNEGELYVSLADHFLPDLKLINTIYYPNGSEVIKIGRKKYSWENEN